MHYTTSGSKTYFMYRYLRHLCLIDWGGPMLECIYIYIYIYMHCTRSSSETYLVYWYSRPGCSIYWGSISLLYIYIYIYIYIYRWVPLKPDFLGT